jgi:hypothetical protein
MTTRLVRSIALVVFCYGTSAYAQPTFSLDATARRAAINGAAAALRSRYVSPDVGERAAGAIESALAEGEYDNLVQLDEFAQRLTADLQVVTADKHVQVLGPPALSAPDTSPSPRSEGGVSRADRLVGNIGYVEIVALGEPALFNSALDRAMASISSTRALIIDARAAAGGSPLSAWYLLSYFLARDKPVHISDTVFRNPGTDTFQTRELWSQPTPSSYIGKPVYVLISDRTLSAGEAFAYEMQARNLGVLVGQTTAGAANAASVAPLGLGLIMMVSTGRTRSVTTGTNWEGGGVLPDLVVSSSDALKAVLDQLGETVTGTELDVLSEARVFTPRSTPHPAAEAAVRRMSEENARGDPNYDLLSPDMAQTTRALLDGLKKMFTDLGPIKSVKFVEVDSTGVDIYEAQYANGSATWTITLTPDGKTAGATVRPSLSTQGR